MPIWADLGKSDIKLSSIHPSMKEFQTKGENIEAEWTAAPAKRFTSDIEKKEHH